METGQPGALKLAHGARDILGPAETCIRVSERRDADRVRDVTRELGNLGERQKPDIRHACGGIGQSGTADINRGEADPFHQSGRRGVERTGHHDAAIPDCATQHGGFRKRFHSRNAED